MLSSSSRLTGFFLGWKDTVFAAVLRLIYAYISRPAELTAYIESLTIGVLNAGRILSRDESALDVIL